ncbi:hypothetical protein E4T42_01986 [Aureobasidium subglaciale]|nr:hypothetical protein E4T42_01986 [Aureobasidium subglaciale]
MEHVTDTKLNAAPPAKRKRVVTACLECYRRKQKVQSIRRPKMMAVALTFKVRQEKAMPKLRRPKCGSKISQSTAPESKSHSPVSADDTTEDDPSLQETASDGTALSSFYDVHAFTDLKKLLEDEEVFQVSSRAPLDQNKPCSKFWILAAQLPDPRVLAKAFNYYFDEVHWRYNVGQKCYMDAQLERWTTIVSTPASQRTGVSKDLPYFVVFSFELLAVILQYMRHDREIARLLHATNEKAAVYMSRRYNDVASELLLVLGRHNGPITVVDYDLLRASWLKNNGCGIESWYAISDGIRHAQQLNLHREPRSVANSPELAKNLEQFWSQEYGRRVWVNLFCWDSGTAMNLGRPRIINAKDCDVNLPIDCPFPDDPSKTVPIPKDEHTPSPLSLLLFRYAVARKIHEIREFGLDKQDADYSSVWAFHESLNNLLKSMPHYINPNDPATYLDSSFSYLPLHREEASSGLNLVIMELHRPFIAMHAESRIAVMNAAIGSIDNQHALMDFSGKHHYVYFGFGFYPANAAITLAAIALVYPSHGQIEPIEKKIKQALSILVNIQATNIVARAALPVVQRLYDKVRYSLQQNLSGSPNASSPESAPSQDSGYIPMTTSMLDPTPLAPISTEFMVEDTGYLPMHDAADMPSWTDVPQINDFDATFWLEQLNKMPENMSLNGVVNPDALWS